LFRIAIVDRWVGETWYSYVLADALRRYKESIFLEKNYVKYYANKERKGVEKVWGKKFFWIQVPYRAWRDRMDVVQINFEVGVFGGFLTNLFIPIMMILLRLSGKRVVTVVHAVTPKKFFDESNIDFIPKDYPSNVGLLKIGMFCAYWLIERLSNKLVVHADIFRDWFREYIASDKIVVIPHGVMKDRFVDESFLEEEEFDRLERLNELVILCFGVISPRKGYHTLISAFSKIDNRDVNLVIVGKEMPYFSEYLDELKKMVLDMDDDRILFFGEVSDHLIHQFYEVADIAVLPYRVSVSASGALAFAMQHEKPTIVSNTEFFVEELSIAEALHFSIGDSDELAECIEKFLKSEDLRRVYGKNIGLKGKKNSWDNVAKMFMEIYQ